MKGIVKKFGAGVVIGAMLMGVTSCGSSSIHPKKFRDKLLDETTAVEYDFDEFEKMDDIAMYEDGIVIYEDSDVEKCIKKFDDKTYRMSRIISALSHVAFTAEDVDGYEVKDAVFYLYAPPEDEDTWKSYTTSKYIRFSDREQAEASFEDYCDRISEAYGLELDKMDDSAFTFYEYDGYLIITLNKENILHLVNAYLDGLMKEVGGEYAGVRDEYASMYPDGFEATMFVCLKGRTISSTVCWNYEGGDELDPILEYLGMDDPFKVENNIETYHALSDAGFGKMIAKGEG